MIFRNISLVLVVSSVLISCGGGGGGSSDTPAVTERIVITKQPTNMSLKEGDALVLNPEYKLNDASATIKFKWFKDGKELYAQQSQKLNISTVSPSDAGTYTFEISILGVNPQSVTSLPAVVTVQPKPTKAYISGGISAEEVSMGDNATLSVVAYGYPAVTYQWYRQGIAIAGATDKQLVLTNVKKTDAADYYVVVKNDLGQAQSNTAFLSVVDQRATGFWSGTIGTQATDLVVTPSGKFVMFREGDSLGENSAIYAGTIKTAKGTFGQVISFQNGSALATVFNSDTSNKVNNIQYAKFSTFSELSPLQTIADSSFDHVSALTSSYLNSIERKNVKLNYVNSVSTAKLTIAGLAATWTYTKPNAKIESSHITIAVDGSFASDSFVSDGNCAASGNVSAVDGSTAFLAVTLTTKSKTSTTCSTDGVTYTGYAVKQLFNGKESLVFYVYSQANDVLSAYRIISLSR